MSKTILRKIVTADIPFSEVVTYLDTWNVYGQNLFLSNLKSHLKNGRSIEYVNYSSDQNYLSEIFENVYQGSIKFHNLNIFDWDNPSLQSSLPSEVINLRKIQEKNIIIAVDRLDGALKYLPETKLLRDINVLKQSPNISQVILYCGKDIVPPPFLSSLTHISSAVITLKSSKNFKSICDVFWKKRTGKIIKSTEEFTINKYLEIEYLREVKSDNKIAEEESELCFQTTFNLKLTEDQKRAKNNLILPHTRIQSSGAQIHYIPDKEDDWDDEDPDEDLYAPTHCPGTQSEDAGKANACAGCPNQKICASGAAALPDPDIEVIKERLALIKRKILVLSGKGGVGKSTVTAMISRVLAMNEDNHVGILDVDICGPSQPRVLGVSSEEVHVSGSGLSPVYVDNLSVMSVGFLLESPEDAVIWRGPKKNGMIKKFLKDVDWGDLDYLLIDTPPGTSDEHLSLAQYMASSPNTGAVIVTTPQEVALLDVRKEITFCKKVGIPIIGVIENMATFTCPKCKVESVIFPPTTGGAKALSEEFAIPLLGILPLDPRVAKACDEGTNIISDEPSLLVSKIYVEISQKITSYFENSNLGIA